MDVGICRWSDTRADLPLLPVTSPRPRVNSGPLCRPRACSRSVIYPPNPSFFFLFSVEQCLLKILFVFDFFFFPRLCDAKRPSPVGHRIWPPARVFARQRCHALPLVVRTYCTVYSVVLMGCNIMVNTKQITVSIKGKSITTQSSAYGEMTKNLEKIQ